MTAVECYIAGTYLVRDETQPIPVGKTATDVSVVVHLYPFGWVCDLDGYAGDTSRPECSHIDAARDARRG
jgi:hypothetical protein